MFIFICSYGQLIKKFGPVLLTEFTFPNYDCLHVTDLGGIGKLQLQKQFEVFAEQKKMGDIILYQDCKLVEIGD